MNLCTFGIHIWPRWTKMARKNHLGFRTTQTYHVRRCKRCRKREEK